MNRIAPRTGTAFLLHKGQYLTVIDIKGQQVSDMVVFNAEDTGEYISSGKSIDFEETIRFTKGNFIWSNRSNKLLEIVKDDVGVHDFLLAPCSKETFEIMYKDHDTQFSCRDNLFKNLRPFGIQSDAIPTAFNVFMNVKISSHGGVSVEAPISNKGDKIIFKAMKNLIVALTACSAKDSNGGSFKPIGYKITTELD